MSESTTNVLARTWFDEFIRLAYWIGRKWTKRLLESRGVSCAASELEEYAQDAVCRGFDRFAKIVRKVRGLDRKKRVCQCMVRACQDAVRNRSRFGSISEPAAIRDDATARFRRVRPSALHGTDEERDYLDVEYAPVGHEVQQWEVAQLAEKYIPEPLRQTAIFAAMGLCQADSAVLQHVTDRTVRNRLREIREYLDPMANPYAVIAYALECARLDKWTPWTTA
jgi:hypothetical protein